ncbi:MAG: Ig-like domain-containing protein [Miltoncostaeaceae bacterium]
MQSVPIARRQGGPLGVLVALAALMVAMLVALALPSVGAAQTPGQFDFIDNDPTAGTTPINRATPPGGVQSENPGVFSIEVTSAGTVHVPDAAFCVDMDIGMSIGLYDVLVQTPGDTPELASPEYQSIAWLLSQARTLINNAADPGLEAGALQIAVWMNAPNEADRLDPVVGAANPALEARALELYALSQGKSLTPLTIAASPGSTTAPSTVTLSLTGTPGTTATLGVTSGSGTLGATSVTFDASGQASTTLASSVVGSVAVQATTQYGEIRRVVADPDRPDGTPEAQGTVYLVPTETSTVVSFTATPPPPPPPPAPPSGGTSGTPVTPVTPVGPNSNVCLRPNIRVQVMGTRRAKAGNSYKYKVKVTNRSRRNVAEMVSVRIQVPRGYSVVRRPRGSRLSRGSVIVPLRNIGPSRMRMTMVTLRADRDTAGRNAVRAFVSAKCSRRRAGTLLIRTSPLVQRVSPAVTG